MRKMFRHAKRKTQGTLVTLRAKRPRKAYKSDENYLRAVYRNNKEWLNSHKTYTPSVSLERSFVNSAMEYISQGYTAVQAANKLASSGAFTGKSYRGKVNIYNVILNDKKLYEKFKKETNIKRKEDFEVEKQLAYSKLKVEWDILNYEKAKFKREKEEWEKFKKLSEESFQNEKRDFENLKVNEMKKMYLETRKLIDSCTNLKEFLDKYEKIQDVSE